MNLNRNHFNKALRVLALAYQGGEKVAVGHDWESRVMARIRGWGPLPYRHGFADLFQRYFWRLAAVAALMALILGSVLYHQMGFLSEYEVARLFLENRFDHSLFQILGTS